jgi:hypothetical protein
MGILRLSRTRFTERRPGFEGATIQPAGIRHPSFFFGPYGQLAGAVEIAPGKTGHGRRMPFL